MVPVLPPPPWMSAVVTASFTMSRLRMVFAAYATPLVATNSAMSATTIAGDGRRRRIFGIGNAS